MRFLLSLQLTRNESLKLKKLHVCLQNDSNSIFEGRLIKTANSLHKLHCKVFFKDFNY